MKIKGLIASLMLVFALGATTVFADDATLGTIEYTSNSGSLRFDVTTSTIDKLDQYSKFEIYFDTAVFTFDSANSTTQEDCSFTKKDGKTYVEWSADADPTVINTSAPLATFVFTVNDGKEANVEGATFTLKNAELTKDEWEVDFTVETQVETVTVAGGNQGGGSTVTATAAGTSADGKITAYTIANDTEGVSRVLVKTFENVTISESSRVYVKIGDRRQTFGSDLAEKASGITAGTVTFGIIVDASISASDVLEFVFE